MLWILIASYNLFLADDIGSHVENAHSSTAQGRSHLVKASRTQRSNSSLVKWKQGKGNNNVSTFIHFTFFHVPHYYFLTLWLLYADVFTNGDIWYRSTHRCHSTRSLRSPETHAQSWLNIQEKSGFGTEKSWLFELCLCIFPLLPCLSITCKTSQFV